MFRSFVPYTIFHFVAAFVLGAVGSGMAQAPPQHLTDAEAFVSHLELSRTSYEHGRPLVRWTEPVESHTDCSGFLDALLEHSYGFDREALYRWMGSHRPTAARYHDAVEKENGFTRVLHVEQIRPGDILAVKYFHNPKNTGHVMLAREAPQRMRSKEPLEEGTEQWQVAVMDSSESGHGTTDTRHKRGANGKDHDGVGTGILRVYTHADGTVAGFAWSTLSVSKFASPSDEHLVIGRLKEEFRP